MEPVCGEAAQKIAAASWDKLRSIAEVDGGEFVCMGVLRVVCGLCKRHVDVPLCVTNMVGNIHVGLCSMYGMD